MGLTKAPSTRFCQSNSRVSRKRKAAPRASSGKASNSERRELPLGAVGREQLAGLGDVERAIGLEAPSVQTDGQIVGDEVDAGEVEVDDAGQPVALEERIVREQVGMDDPARQIQRPSALELGEFPIDLRFETVRHAVGGGAAALEQRSPALHR